ncbi:MAG: YhbY family RNA-binding protein [Lachnospiraceae bacterium]|nr:YhbY family RNA-binding protein [Lachnospiraceae bacterium]
MTSKQRAYLKSQAMQMDAVFQLGKSSLTPEFTEAVREAIEARELIKIAVLKTVTDDIRELAHALAERTHSEVVQIIGRKIVLWKQARENSAYRLP